MAELAIVIRYSAFQIKLHKASMRTTQLVDKNESNAIPSNQTKPEWLNDTESTDGNCETLLKNTDTSVDFSIKSDELKAVVVHHEQCAAS